MHDIGRLIAEHERLESYAAGLIRVTGRPEPQPAAACDILQTLARELSVHLADEQDFLFVDHLRAEPTRLEVEVTAFQNEFAGFCEEWPRYRSEWNEENIALDWDEFCQVTARMMAALCKRIDQENTVLIPLALAAGRIRLRAA